MCVGAHRGLSGLKYNHMVNAQAGAAMQWRPAADGAKRESSHPMDATSFAPLAGEGNMDTISGFDHANELDSGETSHVADVWAMKVTAIGVGDAFGTGGRFHTCWRLDAAGSTVCVDFGASSIVGWTRTGRPTLDIDAVVVTHLHGDHFGGLPFLLLESQYVARRTKPLVIAGPPGLTARLWMLCEAMFAGSSKTAWRFPVEIVEIKPGEGRRLADFEVVTAEVLHPSGAPSTAVRLSAGGRTFAYSGDTAWTDALLEVARDADLFVCECYSGEAPVPHHIDWPTLRKNLPRLTARSILVTHLGESAFSKIDEIRSAGVGVAEDGLVRDL